MKFKVLDMSGWVNVSDLFNNYSDLFEVVTLEPTRENLISEIYKYDAYIATLKERADREIIDKATNLKAIFTPTTGLDHIDIAYAAQKNIAVFGTKYDREMLDRITSTAELALTLLLSVVRKLPAAHSSALNGIWARDKFRGMQLSEKTMGIIGYGRLGTIMAQYAKALRMNVIACDRASFNADGVKQVELDELLKTSDVISLHIHLDDENIGLLDEHAFAKMKDGAVIINTSRGKIIDEQALLKALKSKKVGGAGLDVIDGEWMDDISKHPLIEYAKHNENLVITPHIGGTCFEAQRITAEEILEKIADFVKHDGNISESERLQRSKVN